MACMAARSSECVGAEGRVDESRQTALLSACGNGGSAVGRSERCQFECDRQLRQCSSACPTADWDTCTACDLECARRSDDCSDGC